MDIGSGVLSTIDFCIRYGILLRERVNAYKNANDRVDMLCIRVDGVSIKTVELIQSLRHILPSLKREFQEHFVSVLLKLRLKLDGAVAALRGFRTPDENGSSYRVQSRILSKFVEKAKFSALESTLEQHLTDLERWYIQFESAWKLLVLDPGFGKALKSEHLKMDHEITEQPKALGTVESVRQAVLDARSTNDFLGVIRPPSILAPEYSEITGSACVKGVLLDAKPPREVVVEQTNYPPSTGLDKTRRYVCQLAQLLRNCDPETVGLLQCLGVVPGDQGQFRILYAIPRESSPVGLRELLSQAAIPLEGRFLLATSMARSIMSVHTASMVHKSIRPENLLIFFDNSTKNPQAYLVGFESFRPAEAETSRIGDMLWERNLYRHPQRQGLLPDDLYQYNMQHDIYSLGVCLLEIGLWTSFVHRNENKAGYAPHPSLKIDSDIAMSNKQQGAVNIKKRLIELADEQLPGTMGTRYSEVVIACLRCLDKDGSLFEEDDDQADSDGVVIGVRFVEKVLSRLDTISI